MKESLENKTQGQDLKTKTKTLVSVALGYLFLMFFGGAFFLDYLMSLGADKWMVSLRNLGIAFGLAAILKILIYTFKKIRSKEYHLENPLWYELVGDTFAWWVLIIGLNLVNLFFM